MKITKQKGRSVLSKLLTSYTPESQDRRTPKDMFDELDKIFNFQLDPCTSASKPGNLGTPHYYTKKDDGLRQNWSKYKSVFVNPEFAYMPVWLDKSYYESLDSCTVVVLAPVKAETQWWHTYALNEDGRGADEIWWVKGRTTFEDHDNSFIIGIVFLIFNPEKENRRNRRVRLGF